MAGFFNTDLSQQQFLEQYWQKKPLLIRQAFPDFKSPISPDDLAGLACEPEIESRLIEQDGPTGSWQVTHGPLSEDDFSRLAETHWTLLVQDVDKHLPDLQYLLDPFHFIPDWRRDDLMISYAPEFGTVGPHTDGYDVFLLQGMGSRQWQIADEPIYEAKLVEGLDLQILAEFSPDQTWTLQAGDILYLPPHFAHHGVALDDCMTFSIGFRSPTQIDLLDGFVNTLLEQQLGKVHYGDPDLLLNQYSAEIDAQAVARLKKMLHQAIDDAEPALATTLGKVVTETKPSLAELAAESVTDSVTIDDLSIQFKQGNVLQRNLYCRFAWTVNEAGGQLFMAGEVYSVDINAVANLAILTEKTILTSDDWSQLMQDIQSANLLCQLISEGGWYWQTH
ncbi:MAG: cupin domain-containing protein [Methylophagaceae bacterium]